MVQALGFGFSLGSRLRVRALGFGVCGLGFRVPAVRFGLSCSGFRVRAWVRGLGFGLKVRTWDYLHCFLSGAFRGIVQVLGLRLALGLSVRIWV